MKHIRLVDQQEFTPAWHNPPQTRLSRAFDYALAILIVVAVLAFVALCGLAGLMVEAGL